MRLALVLLALLLLSTIAIARTWHIYPDGSGDAPTIQAGIDSAASRDTVRAHPGTYYESRIELTTGVRLVGDRDNPSQVIIDAAGDGRVLWAYTTGVHSPATVVDGITLTGGLTTERGGAIFSVAVGGPVRISHCRIVGNTGNGGAVYAFNTNTLMLMDCEISNNSSSSSGGGVYCAEYSRVQILDCSIVGNTTSGNGAGVYMQTLEANVTIRNSIVAFNVAGAGVASGSGAPLLDCCDLYGNEGGDWVGSISDQFGVNGNIASDPLFCDLGGGDLTLDSASPCLPGNHPDDYDCGLIGAFGQGCDVYTSVVADASLPTRALGLFVSPNPSTGDVTLRYTLPQAGASTIHVYDIRGRVVRSLTAAQPSGLLMWDGADSHGHRVAPGVYFVRLTDGDRAKTKRITLVR